MPRIIPTVAFQVPLTPEPCSSLPRVNSTSPSALSLTWAHQLLPMTVLSYPDALLRNCKAPSLPDCRLTVKCHSCPWTLYLVVSMTFLHSSSTSSSQEPSSLRRLTVCLLAEERNHTHSPSHTWHFLEASLHSSVLQSPAHTALSPEPCPLPAPNTPSLRSWHSHALL